MGVALGRGGEADVATGLLGRHPAPERVEVGPCRGLVGPHHKQLAEPARRDTNRQASLDSAPRPQLARRLEGAAQQFGGKAGAQGREQGRSRRLGLVGA